MRDRGIHVCEDLGRLGKLSGVRNKKSKITIKIPEGIMQKIKNGEGTPYDAPGGSVANIF